MNKLSLCMITLNEEKNIENCLKSVQGIVDEIIVVDTGSTDKTIDICRSNGACIYEYDWNDDFSAARNFGIEKATGEWILWLDADEEMIISDKHNFLKDIIKSKNDLVGIRMIHFYGEHPPKKNRSHRSVSYKIFKNGKKIKFNGSIHEHLSLNESVKRNKNEVISTAIIYHYGYMDENVKLKDKANRNMSLLLKEKNTGTCIQWNAYHIASEQFREQNYKKAYDSINYSISLFLNKGIIPPAMVYKLKYEILLNFGKPDNVIEGLKYVIKLYPDYVDLYYYCGLVLLYQHCNSEAKKYFEHCIEMGENNTNYLTLSGTGSFFAYYYLGVCMEIDGDILSAKKAYQNALVYYPEFSEASVRLKSINDITVKL